MIVYYSGYSNPNTSGALGTSLVDLTSTSFADLVANAATYNSGIQYKKGTIVYDQNSSWVYINNTPTTGNSPPTLPTISNAYWELLGTNGTYTWIAYANSTDGTTFTDFTTGAYDSGSIIRKWIGIAPNKTTGTESTNTADYSWNKIVGENGLNNASVYLYRRSNSVPPVPSVTSTYTFATGVLTEQNNSWTQTIPAGTDPIYVITATAVSQTTSDTILSTEWSSPSILSQNATNSARVLIYRRSLTSPSLPSVTTTYTFATGALTGLNNSWTTTVPAGSDPLWTSAATAFGTDVTDTIASSEWAAPAITLENLIDVGGPLIVGTLPTEHAASGLINGNITIDGSGLISGIGTANINVDNTRTNLQGLFSARPASGQFVNQTYLATDTNEVYIWNGTVWNISVDLTATAQRSIEPQFPIIEIRQGEAGHTGNRIVTHHAKRGTATLGGGTWSIVSQNLGGGTATINSSTGIVTLSSIVQSGSYTVRYTHTDSIATQLSVNVTYIPSPVTNPALASAPVTDFSTSSFAPVTTDLQITLPSGVTSATLTADSINLSVFPDAPTGGTTAQMKWQRESSPGTWSDIGSVATSSPSPFVSYPESSYYEVTDGLITCNHSATGLVAGSVQKFRLVARVSGGNIRYVISSGTAIAEGI
jgi:hypothetical protein